MPRFRYIGTEDHVSIFGAFFHRGEWVEMTDVHAVMKLRNHKHFEAEPETPLLDSVSPVALDVAAAPKRRGRPPKVRPDANETAVDRRDAGQDADLPDRGDGIG